MVTVHTGAETIQGRKLYEEIRYIDQALSLPQVHYLLPLRVLSDYRKELGSGQMGTLLVLASGRIVTTMTIKTVPTSLHQVRTLIKWFYKVFHISSKPVTAPKSEIQQIFQKKSQFY